MLDRNALKAEIVRNGLTQKDVSKMNCSQLVCI